MTLDLGAYFDRIGYGGEAAPNLEVLRALMAAHTGSIPFENLDPLMGVPVDDLSPAALADKLVHRRRGGYCYEQNGLLGYALAEIGFRCADWPAGWCGCSRPTRRRAPRRTRCWR